MQIIEIKPLENGAHRNQTGSIAKVPDGWAVIPENMELENFPFGEVIVKTINGVKTVTKWIPGILPETEPAAEPEPTANDLINAMLGVTSYE